MGTDSIIIVGMKKSYFLLLLSFMVVSLSSCRDKGYSVSTSGNSIYIEMPSMTVGIVGPNQVSYGGVSLYDISESVYNEFHGLSGLFKSGKYNVYLKTKYKNDYGETVTKDKGLVITLDTDEMKRYQSSGYFSGNFEKALTEALWR